MEDLRTDASPIPELRTSEVGAEDDCSSPHKAAPNGNGTGSTPIRMPQTIHLTGSSRIHIGPLYNCIDPASVRTPPPGATSPIHSFAESKKGPPKAHVEALLKSEREVTDAEMDIVCTHIGYGWKQLGHLMKYSDGQLDNIDANSHRPVDKAHELISMWRDRESKKASVANLTRLLMMSSAYDVVKRLHP